MNRYGFYIHDPGAADKERELLVEAVGLTTHRKREMVMAVDDGGNIRAACDADDFLSMSVVERNIGFDVSEFTDVRHQ